MKKEELDRTDKSKAVQDNSSFFIICLLYTSDAADEL